MGKYTGKWLPAAPKEHMCNLPFPTFAGEGRRWMCEALLDGTDDNGDPAVCRKVWRVERDQDGKGWVPDQPETPDTELKVFRLATDTQIEEWLIAYFDGSALSADRTLVAAIRKHFVIGVRE